MPFQEIKPPTDFVRITKVGRLTISVSLYRKFFLGKKVKIFHDEQKHLIGLKPSDEGYKITVNGGSSRVKCSFLGEITQGEFNPKWSKKHKMLILQYEAK